MQDAEEHKFFCVRSHRMFLGAVKCQKVHRPDRVRIAAYVLECANVPVSFKITAKNVELGALCLAISWPGFSMKRNIRA